MLKFDYGANSKNFRVNKTALIPTPQTAACGFRAIGMHNVIGMSPDALCQQAYEEWMRTVMTAIQATANRSVSITADMVGAYLQFCAIADIVMAEAKRDLLMAQFGDVLSTSAARDYWGPNYASILSTLQTNGPLYWSRWNSLARLLAEQFPHITSPYFEQFKYLVGNVFKDSDSGRWRFLYLHMFNNTFDDATVDPVAALDFADVYIHKFMEYVDLGTYTITPQALAEIKSGLLNSYGDKCAVDYGVVIDYFSKPTVVYDPDLVAMLNNAVLPPTIIGKYIADSVYQTRAIGASGLAAYCAMGAANLVDLEVDFTVQDIPEADADVIVAGYQACATAPVVLHGPQFDGAAGLYNTSLIENWDAIKVPFNTNFAVYVNPYSHFGITMGRWFWFNVSPNMVCTLHTGATGAMQSTVGSFTSNIRTVIFESLNQLNQMDFGNFLYWDGSTGNFFTLAEPIDEFAIISRASLATYTDSGIMGLFDAGVTNFRSYNVSKYVATDNTSRVVSGRWGDDNRKRTRGGRYGKTKKK